LFLQKKPIVSNASRNVLNFRSLWVDRRLFRALKWRRLSKGGRGSTGRIVVWTKSSIKTRLLHPTINYSFRHHSLGFIATFKVIPFQNKLTSLTFLASGGVTYLAATEHFKIFHYLCSYGARSKIKDFLQKPLVGLLFRARILSKVSLLEVYPGSGIQYVRSAGSCARVIRINLNNHTSVIKLPSGMKKSFSLYSLASLGRVALRDKRRLKNTRSGYWRTYGVKPHVRGVARNPVDHPHGGRTKSIKYPRTPWGKTTKYK
jgi:large subunit ribosomal protein L2